MSKVVCLKENFKKYSYVFNSVTSKFSNHKVHLIKNKDYDCQQNHVGVYAIWIKNESLKRTFQITTKKNSKSINIRLKDYPQEQGHYCLYIGKTGTEKNICNRLSQHLRGNEKPSKIIERIQRVAGKQKDPIKFIVRNLKYSFVEEKDLAKRFFLENEAIGELRPIFNIEG